MRKRIYIHGIGNENEFICEWLEQQTVAGWLKCINPENPNVKEQKPLIPGAHINLLVNPDSLMYKIPSTLLVAGVDESINELAYAYKDDTGISWTDFGDDTRESQAIMNRPLFLQRLGPALEENDNLKEETLFRPKYGNGKSRISMWNIAGVPSFLQSIFRIVKWMHSIEMVPPLNVAVKSSSNRVLSIAFVFIEKMSQMFWNMRILNHLILVIALECIYHLSY